MSGNNQPTEKVYMYADNFEIHKHKVVKLGRPEWRRNGFFIDGRCDTCITGNPIISFDTKEEVEQFISELKEASELAFGN